MHTEKKISQKVRFEEATPANEPIAFIDIAIRSLEEILNLSIFNGYDDLGDIDFAFLELESMIPVTIGEHLNSPQAGTSLYVDELLDNSLKEDSLIEFISLVKLPKINLKWVHANFNQIVENFYQNSAENYKEILLSNPKNDIKTYEPIDCFKYALRLYERVHFPKYWAMLQRNLGLAYSQRLEGTREENILYSISCFNCAIQVHSSEKMIEAEEIDRHELYKASETLNSIQFLNIESANLFGINLHGISLTFANLSEANLSGANLNGANLSEANLSGANLREANLSGANLREAKLHEANLSGANLRKADLSGANLRGANLSGADLSGANLIRTNLSGANLSGTILIRANLSGPNLSGANLSGANLSGAYLLRANLSRANLRRADLTRASLSESNLSGANLREAKPARG